jgi:hypothetical protein
VVEPSTRKRRPLGRSWPSQGLAAARPLLQRGQEPLDTRPTPPSPGRRSTRRASGSTGSDRGAWVTHWSSRLPADQLGISHSTVARVGPSTTSTPGRPRPSGSPATRSWRPESATWSGCPLEPSAHAIVLGVWTRSRRSRRWSAPSLPAPTPGAARRRPRHGAATHRGRLRALPMTGWAGERPACPYLRKLRQ